MQTPRPCLVIPNQRLWGSACALTSPPVILMPVGVGKGLSLRHLLSVRSRLKPELSPRSALLADICAFPEAITDWPSLSQTPGSPAPLTLATLVWFPGLGGGGIRGYYFMDTECSLQDERVLEVDGGDGCTCECGQGH